MYKTVVLNSNDSVFFSIGSISQAEKNLANHPNKEIREALKEAASAGWTVKKSGPRAHAWGTIKCGFRHRSCWMAIYSTPRSPRNHASAASSIDFGVGTSI